MDKFQVWELFKSAQDILRPIVPYVAGAFVWAAAQITLRATLFRQPIKQSFVPLSGVEPQQQVFLDRVSIPDLASVVSADLGGREIKLIDIDGRPYYYVLVSMNGTKFALGAESLDAIKLAKGEPLLNGRDAKSVKKAHLVELEPGQNLIERLRMDAARSIEATLASDNLFKLTPDNPDIKGRDIQISIADENAKRIVSVNYRPPKHTTNDVSFYRGTFRTMRMDITELSKIYDMDMIIGGLYQAVSVNSKVRRSLLRDFFVKDPGFFSKWLSRKAKGVVKALSFDDFILLIDIASPSTAGFIAQDRIHKFVSKSLAPHSMRGLVADKPESIGGHAKWLVEDGALKEARFDDLPVHLEDKAHRKWDEFSEFLKEQFFAPQYAIHCQSNGHTNYHYGYSMLSGDGGRYGIYNPKKDFLNYTSDDDKVLVTSEVVRRIMQQFVLDGGRVEHMLAAKELLGDGKRVLRYDAGKIYTALVESVYSRELGAFLPGYTDPKHWREETPEKTNALIAAKRAQLQAARPESAVAMVAAHPGPMS